MGHMMALRTELMQGYIPRPVPVMAVQITDDNAKSVALMVGGKLYPRDNASQLRIYFHCCDGRVKAEWGDWIIRDAKGFSTMTNANFINTYQEKQ